MPTAEVEVKGYSLDTWESSLDGLAAVPEVKVTVKRMSKRAKAKLHRTTAIGELMETLAEAEKLARVEFTKPEQQQHLQFKVVGTKMPWAWVHLPCKPSESLDAELRKMGFRYNKRRCWYQRPSLNAFAIHSELKTEQVFSEYGATDFSHGKLVMV